MSRALWGSALATATAAAMAIAGLVPLVRRLEPRGGLRLLDPTELWLLAVFTLGVLCVLVGLSAAIGGWWFNAPGPRERLEGRPLVPRSGSAEKRGTADPAGWLMIVGAGLLGLYALGWLVAG